MRKDYIQAEKPKYHWKLHIIVALFLIVISFIGTLMTNFTPARAWTFWRLVIPVFALACIGLNWLESRRTGIFDLIHEILHWGSILAAIYLISLFVKSGEISDIGAGFFILTLLALGAFMAGIYVNKIFYMISLVQAIFIVIAVMFIKYLIIIGIFLMVAVLLFLFWRGRHMTAKKSPLKEE